MARQIRNPQSQIRNPLPLEARLTLLFILGAFVGGQLNRGIYRFALLNPRLISPWSRRPEKAGPRTWRDRLPIVGWFFLRRETEVHGAGFWIRPLLIELAMAVGFAWLYLYETQWQGVFQLGRFQPDAATLHAQYFVHLTLISLMVVATFIDFDEQMIPDPVTVPGALLGMVFAALLPASRPLASVPTRMGLAVEHLHATTASEPADWNVWLASGTSLGIALACYLAWYVAIVPWIRATPRRRNRAVGYFVSSLVKRSVTPFYGSLLLLGPLAIAFVWWRMGGVAWESLFSALLGIAWSGGLVWVVRVVATSALQKEAMGFGDVLLMGMIGAYVGWQGSLAVFFLAPLAAVIIAITQFILTRRSDLAFGPYLCLATLLVVLNWGWLWNEHLRMTFSLGWFVPSVVVLSIGLMWLMLLGLQFLKQRVLGFDDEDDAEQADAARC